MGIKHHIRYVEDPAAKGIVVALRSRRKLRDIASPARMMTACGIHDVFTVFARPHKKAVSSLGALEILDECPRDEEIGAGLFRLSPEWRMCKGQSAAKEFD